MMNLVELRKGSDQQRTMRGKASGSFPRPFLNSDEDEKFQRWMDVLYLVCCVNVGVADFKKQGRNF